jgi:hypothetical protein
MRPGSFAATMLLITAIASRAGAQGALSLQGLGFPPGQMSARAEGTGGGLADFDALSLTTPASIAGVGGPAVFFQYSPEFRKVTVPDGGVANTTTARFPLAAGVLPMGQSWTLGLSVSTFLDRSHETTLKRAEPIGEQNDTVELTERTRVLGAINDVRLALAFSSSPKVRVGFGAHVFSGSNRITFQQLFPDSSIFISNTQLNRISYAGFAASAGIEIHPGRAFGFALSGRKGGDLRAEDGNTVIGTGRIPDHYSASLVFEGVPGASLSLRVAHDSWSSLASLESSHFQAFDGWDTGFGAEVSGPRVFQRIIAFRAGARIRTLPFGYNGEKVSETALAGGIGIPLSRDRAALDFTLQHAARSAANIEERSYILSFGLRVSP